MLENKRAIEPFSVEIPGVALFLLIKMIKVSAVCPLLFNNYTSIIERPIEYFQKFAVGDPDIIIQSVDEPGVGISLSLIGLSTGTSSPIPVTTYEINSVNTLYEFVIPVPSSGIYQVRLSKGNAILDSLPFSVCPEEKLKETALISYSHGDNTKQFGAIFILNNNKRTFHLRVEAGFKSDGVTFNVENEQFRSQRQEIIETYAVPYITETFTIGNNIGVPVSMASLINNALCLSEFKIDGVPYKRKDSSVPEKHVIQERFPQYNFTIELQKGNNEVYNGFIEAPETVITPSGVEIITSNPKDGEVLQYRQAQGAFVNSSKI